MNNHLWWNLTRASANIAMILILLTVLWGILLATRVLKPNDRPAWIRDLHTWLGGLSVSFSVLHILTLIADSYVHFTFVSVLIPFTSSWRPFQVSLGILAFYILVAVQASSLMMKKISKTAWHRIHMASYAQFPLVILHALMSGSDVGKNWYAGFTMSVAMVGAAVFGLRAVAGKASTRRTSSAPPK
jgi:predicted ferric reductase